METWRHIVPENYKLSKADKNCLSSITEDDRKKLEPAGDLEIMLLFQLRDRIKDIDKNLIKALENNWSILLKK